MRDALLVKAKDGAVSGKMSLEQWQAVIDVNLTGVFLCGREAAERMIRLGKGGVIVNISSISRHGNVGQSNYTAAKAGVAALAVVWARELARYGIRVGAIAPGFTHTGILDSMRPELLDKMVAPVPVRSTGPAGGDCPRRALHLRERVLHGPRHRARRRAPVVECVASFIVHIATQFYLIF